MAIQNNKRILHRKEWQPMSNMKANSAAGSFVIKDYLGIKRLALFVVSSTSQYLYAADEDDYMPITSMALGGTFGAGSCGAWGVWSNTLTATGGSTTTLTLTTGINNAIVGNTIRFLTGSNAGYETVAIKAKILPGGTNTVTFSPALPNAVANNDTFKVDTGIYYVWNAGTMSATSFKSIDPLTGVVTALSVTNAPASWGTDGKMCSSPSYVCNYRNITGTVTSATATTFTDTSLDLKSGIYDGSFVWITAGTGVNQIRKITSSTANTFTVPTWTINPDSTSTYKILGSYSVGLCTASGNTTITDSTKSYTADNFCNYQIRIIAGTGIGQVRTITSNTATQITVPTWTQNPDTTSVFVIEPNDDFLYLTGNAAVTMYRYSISGNSWSTLAPTAARNTAPNVGMGLCFIGKTNDVSWNDETNLLDGRYIYSFRGNATSALDRYDIAGGTAGAGTWAVITYLGASDTFTTGSSYDVTDGRIFIKRNATNIFYYYYVPGNNLYPFATDAQTTDGTAVLGDKLFTVAYDDKDGQDIIEWLYYWQNTGTIVKRIMIY